MFPTWLLLSVAALLIWGAWGMFANLTARHLDGYSALVWEVMGAMIVGGLVLGWVSRNGGLDTAAKGAGFGLATGITYTAGLVFLFLALNQVAKPVAGGGTVGSVHTVLILTALYPVVAVLLNYFLLSDPISIRQLVGMGVGLTGIAILMTSS